ncbi:hypothetical protein FRC19_007320 [Serendipita sp. 401]|nr:hypothetical protein FRC19_007320 [Serendipita sp. 401]
MQPQNDEEKRRRPIGRPVEEESDDDPDFVRGPIPQPPERQPEKTKSGKKRKSKEKQSPDTSRPTKRRRVTKSWPKSNGVNPLIKLLDVEDDPYFAKVSPEVYESLLNDEDRSQGRMRDSMNTEARPLGASRALITSKIKQEDDDLGTEEDDVTEDDDEEPSSFDVEALKRYNISVEEIVRKMNGQTSKSESRRLRRLQDPEATESDSDSDISPTFRTSDDVNKEENPTIPEFNPRPQFGSRPRTSGPYILNRKDGIQIPASINDYLRPYQKEGVRFLFERYCNGRGAILGDDMGLGKTVQVISFLSAIMKKHGDERDQHRRYLHVDNLLESGHQLPRCLQQPPKLALPAPNAKWPTCLLVTPVPLIDNWRSELETWGYFEFGVYDSGSTSINKEKNYHILTDFRMGRLDIVLVPMTMLVNKISEFCDLDWSVIIVDEAHKLKNPAGKTVSSLDQIRKGCRFGLTGTAIQNNYEELWTLLNWANSNSVGSLAQWKHSISQPLKQGQSSTATSEELQRAKTVSNNLVKKLLPHFFIRRTKKLLEDQLPKKIDQVAFCPLTETQKEVYQRFLNTEEMKTMLRRDESCDCGSGSTRAKCCHAVPPGKLLEYINIFIKVSNSLALILPVRGESESSAQISQKLQAIAFPNTSNAELFAPMQANPEELCGKWKVLRGLLNDWREENESMNNGDPSDDIATATRRNKVLIFTKSKKLLDFVEHTLQYEGYEYRTLHGDLKREERQKNIAEFQDDPDVFVFLITTQTGGVGLNLTAANKVIIFDPNWNPAHDLQAMDRAFRLGQVRDVEVFRLLGGGSIEELVYKRQVYKQQMMITGYEARGQMRYFDAVQGDKQRQGDLFGIKNLFALTEGDTHEKIERARLREDVWRLQAEQRNGASDGTESAVLDLLTELPGNMGKSTREKKNSLENQLKRHGVKHVLLGEELLLPAEEQVKLYSGRIPSRKNKEPEETDHSPQSPRRRNPAEEWVPRHISKTNRKTKVMELSDSE